MSEELHMLKTKDLLSLDETLAKDFLSQYTYPWEALPHISAFIEELGNSLPKDEYEEVSEHVWIHKSAKVMPSAYIGAPCIIGAESEVRHCAFIRGSALIGEHCVVGNSSELKNVILFNYTQVPHYNYVGDSILGFHAHMGAGSITSNVKGDKQLVIVHGDEEIETGLKKFGAILGDYAEIGCNAVMNPGSVIGKNARVYPTSCVRGVVPDKSIYKNNGEIYQQNEA